MQEIIEIEKWAQTNKEYILNALSELIQINTVNLPPGGNEKPGQDYIYNKISSFISEKDIDVFEIDDVPGIRQNPGGIGADTDLGNPIYKLSKIALALKKYDKYLKTIKPPKVYRDDLRIKLLTYQFYSGGSSYPESGAVPTEGHIYFFIKR